MPPTLHIKAVSGPRPVTAAAARELLARERIGARSLVLSLDRGLTWMAAEDALAVVDRLAVADHDVDSALAAGRGLHPIAMPLGALGIVLLAAGIGFGGGPAAGAIAAAPATAATAAGTLANAGADGLASAGHAAIRLAVAGWSACLAAGSPSPDAVSTPSTPAAGAHAGAERIATPVAVAASDLERAWSALIADRRTSDADWLARADALAAQTRSAGIDAWQVSITQAEPFAASMRDTFPKARRAQRFVELQVAQDADGGGLLVLLAVEGADLVRTLDGALAAQRRVRVSAEIEGVSSDAAARSAVLIGYLRAITEE